MCWYLSPAAASPGISISGGWPSKLESLGNFLTTAIVLTTTPSERAQLPGFLSPQIVDSGCYRSLTGHTKFVHNIRSLQTPIAMHGFAGGRRVFNKVCDIKVPVHTDLDKQYTLTIDNALYDPSESISLLATRDLRRAGFKFTAAWESDLSPICAQSSLPCIPLVEFNGLPALPVVESTSYEPRAFVANCGNMSLEELTHLRLGHLPISRLARSSKLVTGLPRPLRDTQTLRLPCSICQEAKAKRQPFPQASPSYQHRNTKMICWDMLDMKTETWGGNQYCSLFLIVDSHLIIGFLHSDKTAQTCQEMLKKVFTRAGFIPSVIRCDQAAEYMAHSTKDFLQNAKCAIESVDSSNVTCIESQHSNPGEQFQNGKSEKLVDVVGQGTRAVLLQSGLDTPAWGAAMLYYIDILNSVTSSAVDNQIPFELHTGKKADWSWFRPFGCKATVWLGKDLVEHHKLSPRGEAGVFVGLGMNQGRKCWLIYLPKSRRVVCTRNVTFDDTLFPLRQVDQRVFGYYDHNQVQELRAHAFPSESYTNFQDICQLPLAPSVISGENEPSHLLHSILDDQIQHNVPLLPRHTDDIVLPGENYIPLDSLDHSCSGGGNSSSGCGGGDSAASTTDSQSQSHTSAVSPSSSTGGGNTSRLALDQMESEPAPLSDCSTHTAANSDLLMNASDTESVALDAALPTAGTKRNAAAMSSTDSRRKVLHWWDVQFDHINDCTDEHLAEFCIGHSLKLTIPEDFYSHGGNYYGEIIDTLYLPHLYGKKQLCASIVLTSGPRSVTSKGQFMQLQIPISKFLSPAGVDISLRRILRQQFPNAKLCQDLTVEQAAETSTPPSPPKVVSTPKVRRSSRIKKLTNKSQSKQPPQDNKTNLGKLLGYKSKAMFPGLFALTASLMLTDSQDELDFRSCYLPAEPKNQRDALNRPDSHLWKEAEHIELRTVWDMDTFEIVDLPEGVTPLPSMFTYRLKVKPCTSTHKEIIKRKARIVLRGDLQTEDEFSSTFAPTSKFTAVRTLISLATQNNLKLKSWDIQGAFMCSDIDNDNIYVTLPPGYTLPEGKVLKLRKSLYGLRQAPGLFHDTLESWLREYGFRPIDPEGTIFRLDRPQGHIIMSIFVDDGLCATSSEELYQQFISDMGKKFKLSDQGDLDYYLGVSVNQDIKAGVTTMDQSHYIKMLADRFQMVNCNPVYTPLPPHTRLTKEDSPTVSDKEATKKYQQLVGGLLYTANFCRPDVAHAVNQCAKFMQNPGPKHLNAAKHILAYLITTSTMGLTYRRSSDPAKANVLSGFADADHAGDPDGRRSITGYCLILNGAAISWSSVRQQAVSLSSCEAEFYSASACGTDVQYCRRLLEQLGYPQKEPTQIGEDNMACIYLSRSASFTNRVKHIDVRIYHLRDLCKSGIMSLYKVSSAFQVADSLTKSTPLPLFRAHRAVLLGSSPSDTT